MDVTVGSARFRVGGGHDAFWRRVIAGDWEPDSYGVLDRFLTPGSVLVDVGAWIGPLTLYAAAIGARSHAFEPDPVARAELLANLARNPELAGLVQVSPAAVGAAAGSVRLGNRTSAGGGDSMSSLLFAESPVGWEVSSVGLAEVLDGIADDELGLVKIDIEGAEAEVLSAAAAHLAARQPPLFVSVHARFWSDPRPRLEQLEAVLAGYDTVLTPGLRPFEPSLMLAEPYASGLFEVVACRGRI
ncbi:FkbM family methyltransferase [Micromonospora sp. NPDC005806]|uniref:FkbM family methyltransferase n=1 Tax=Micromonospora sp. NPDC005806 TaxID=3364234 RepID=UPI0036CC36B8